MTATREELIIIIEELQEALTNCLRAIYEADRSLDDGYSYCRYNKGVQLCLNTAYENGRQVANKVTSIMIADRASQEKQKGSPV
jgi:hypothetical protein